MTKKARIQVGQSNSEEGACERIRKALGSRCACYVLITCSEPSETGKMEVELNFEGDEALAAFLIDNAAQVFEERIRGLHPTYTK